MTDPSTDSAPDPMADRILAGAIRVVARGEDRDAIQLALLDLVAARFGIGSAAVALREPDGNGLRLAATFGLGPDAAAGLTAAIANPAHPVTVTATTGLAGFDVRPMNPGGPALRTHLPLVARRQDADVVVGVLALAHDEPLAEAAPLLEPFADLLAIVVAYTPTS